MKKYGKQINNRQKRLGHTGAANLRNQMSASRRGYFQRVCVGGPIL